MNIIFPMLGIGSRFQKAGFLMPKYLLDLAEEKILYFVLYGFRNLNKFNFIFLIRKDHNKYNPKYEINRINNSNSDLIHIDIMDGKFVPNNTMEKFDMNKISCVNNDIIPVKEIFRLTNDAELRSAEKKYL